MKKHLSKKYHEIRVLKRYPNNAKKNYTGMVMVMGQGDAGQLGLGNDVLEIIKPKLVDKLPPTIVDIAAGGMHSIALSEKGVVYTWGCNDEGALGRDGENESVPVEIQSISDKIVQISAGDSHSAVLSHDGKVYIWGVFRDKNGKIGLIQKKQIEHKPVLLQPLVKMQKISSGADHLLLLGCDGIVYSLGCSEQCQRGNVKRENWLTVLPLILECKCSDVWAGTYSSFAKVQSNESIIAFGLNNHCQFGYFSGQLNLTIGDGNPLQSLIADSIKCISCADHHTIVMTHGGFVYSAGRKEYGRLGTGDKEDNEQFKLVRGGLQNRIVKQISAGPSVSFAVTRNGSLYSWGMGDSFSTGREFDVSRPKIIKSLKQFNVIKASAGGQHCLILTDIKRTCK